jgi:acyl-CoA thioester hydrolase
MTDVGSPGASIRLRVRYAETDQMGRAHHMQYLAWFELGRTELIRAAGMVYADMEKQGILLPVAHAEVEYRRGVGYDELVEIETRVSDVRSRSVTFAYRALRAADGEVLATGTTRLVCTDSEGRPRRIPAPIAEMLIGLTAPAAKSDGRA